MRARPGDTRPPLPEWLRFVRELTSVYLDAITREMKRLGLISDPTLLERAIYWTYFAVFSIPVLFVPTWEGEAVIFFGALLALAVAWLVAVPQAAPELSPEEIALVERGIAKFGNLFRQAAERRGKQYPYPFIDLSEPESSWLGRALPSIFAGGVDTIVLQIMFGRSIRALELSALALLGLLAGPWLSHFHLGYWSPVSILFAVAVPDALLLLITLIVPVMLKLYIAALRFDELNLEPPPSSDTPTADV